MPRPAGLAPAAGGRRLENDWRTGPETSAFQHGDGSEEVLDRFEEAVLTAASGGRRPGVCVRLGGFSDPWDTAPDEGDDMLLAQMAGQAVDHGVFTVNLIVGTREDIVAGRYTYLRYAQRC
ncbi:hypothetical protein [Streptomyces antibioticus]|uniref:hypothetical protein n=1 Tax=Streptomyces antibioticus TaxID=1890 RepID=UPI0034015C84